MPSEVDICNLALSNLGDTATVSSIYPPEGSAQSDHCARFYPIARDSLLEMHFWNFATRRDPLVLLKNVISPWLYCYSKPNMMKQVISVIPPQAGDDYTAPAADRFNLDEIPVAMLYVPQPYAIETLSDGTEVICTNQDNAILRYTVSITDPTKFSTLFVVTLSWLLSSMLAGPLIKGDAGAAEAKRCLGMVSSTLAMAKSKDSDQRKARINHAVPWIAAR